MLPIRTVPHTSSSLLRALSPRPFTLLATPPPFHYRTLHLSTPQMASTSISVSVSDHIKSLKDYTACDIADALLKLKVPNAGYLSDLTLRTNSSSNSSGTITIAAASTVVFASKNGHDAAGLPDANIPPETHWVDLSEPGTIIVMAQPEGQKCAVLGGIMALRMQVLDAKGIVVHGRVRDIDELNETGLPVSASQLNLTS